MSVALPSAVALPARPHVWTEVSPGFYVGSRRGEFLGSVDRTGDGSFIAFDGRSTPIGRYGTLREAKRAIRDVSRAGAGERFPRLAAMSQTLAPVCGLLAAGMLAVAGYGALPPL